MKKFQLSLTIRSDDLKSIDAIEVIESDNIIQLTAQFALLMVRLQEKLCDDKLLQRMMIRDDDIPF